MIYYGHNDYRDYLAHHGILGQRWGKRNGPPYPLGTADHSASEKKAGWEDSLKNKKKDKASRERQLVSDIKAYASGKTKAVPKEIDEILSSEAAMKVIDAQRKFYEKNQELWNNEETRKLIEKQVADEYIKTGKYRNVEEAIYDMNHEYKEAAGNRMSDVYTKKEQDDYNKACNEYVDYARKTIDPIISKHKNRKIKPSWSNNPLTVAQWCNLWLYDWEDFDDKAYKQFIEG